MIIAIGTAALILACSSTDTPPPPPANSNINYPDTQLDDAVISFTEDGIPSVLINSSHIDRWEKEDSTTADSVLVYFYDKQGIQRSSLKADRGLIREKAQAVALFGNVIAVNEDSTVLTTESLFWNPTTELITTDDYVEVKRVSGDRLTGYGLKADRNLNEIEILRDVKGKMTELTEPIVDTSTEQEQSPIEDTLLLQKLELTKDSLQ